jgi:Restriction endonuclease/NACHT domain
MQKSETRCAGYSDTYQCKSRSIPGESLCSYCKGRRFELDVCDVLREMGASVIHNVQVDGSQCDVIATFDERLDQTTYYVECKAEAAPVGVNTVTQFYSTFQAAARSRHFDKGMLISQSGFTAEARTKAMSLSLVCYAFDELREKRADFRPYLEAMVSEYESSAFFMRKYYLNLDATTDLQKTPAPLDELLDGFCEDRLTGPLLLVLGDLGAGKSTTLRRFFWRKAKDYLTGNRNSRIPILINLKDFHVTMDLNKTLIGTLIDEYGLRLDGLRTFRNLNAEGRLTILLDSFDEMLARVGPDYLSYAFQQFEKVVCPKAKVVITIRTHFLKDSSHLGKLGSASDLQLYAREKGYPAAYIQPLGPDKIEDYIRHVAGFSTDKVLGNERLGQLSSRPILLDMVVETLPQLLSLPKEPRISDLYYTYTEQWLDRDDWRCKMTHAERRFFSEELASLFHKRRITSVHFSDLQPIIKDYFPELRQFSELEHFDVDVRTSSFLSRNARGDYSFSHKSFFEYFLASKIIRDAKTRTKMENGKAAKLATPRGSREPPAETRGFVQTASRLSTETLDFMEDIIRSQLAEWTCEEAESELLSFFDILCHHNDRINAGVVDPSGRERPSAEEIQTESKKILTFLQFLFRESRSDNSVLCVFHYAARKYLGNVSIACSPRDWRKISMRKVPGFVNQFFSFLVVPEGQIEYKYLEDLRWEPYDNRQIRVHRAESIKLLTDQQRGGTW